MKANLIIAALLFFGGLYNLYSQSSHWPASRGNALPLKDFLQSALFVLGLGLLSGVLLIAICWLACRIARKSLPKKTMIHLLLMGLSLSSVLFLWFIPMIV